MTMYGLMNTQKYEHANLPHIIIKYTTHMHSGLCMRRSVEYVQAFTNEVFADICCKNNMNLHPKLFMKNYFYEFLISIISATIIDIHFNIDNDCFVNMKGMCNEIITFFLLTQGNILLWNFIITF